MAFSSTKLAKFALKAVVVLWVISLLSPGWVTRAQQEDTDTDTTLLVLRIEKAVSLQVVGSLTPTTITVQNSDQAFVSLGSLSLIALALGNYRVVASAESPATFGFSPALIELRVSQLSGVFVPGTQLVEFAPLGPSVAPLTLWRGFNNAGTRTAATVEARLNLNELGGDLPPNAPILLNFTVVEEG